MFVRLAKTPIFAIDYGGINGQSKGEGNVIEFGFARASMWSFFKEFFRFARQEKKWWLIPLIVVFLLVGAVVILTARSGIAWGIYK
ncbi:MAG TPA: DUF5989 family protein [Patescibacteria group bacterium]|jgi:hypothetical protein|nr:DUF5989 family protein [Patescibacteria group bacterium]